MKVNEKDLNPGKFQEDLTKFSEINLLSRRVDRLTEEVKYGISKVVIENEIRLIKDQIKKLEEMF